MSRSRILALAACSGVAAVSLLGLGTRVVRGQNGPFTLQLVLPGVQLNSEPMTAKAPQPVSAPDQVRTDATGQALLAAAGGSCQLQVLPGSSLVLGACPRGGAADANSACLESGGAVLRACPGFVLQTAGADVRMDDGWASVNQDPSSGRTTVLVLKGRSNVAEVYDLAGSGASAFVPVDAGHFLVTTPGTADSNVAGLAERTALPTSDLAGPSGAAGTLGLSGWLNQSLVQAAVDGTTFGAPAAPASPPGTCTVTANGLRLRYGPGTGYGVITSLPAGTTVRPVGQGAGATWYSVQVLPSNRLGWVSANYLACNGVNGASLPAGQVLTPPATPIRPTPSGSAPATPLPSGPVPATPMPPPNPNAQIDFWADRTTLRPGECTKLHWNVSNVRSVYFNGEGVAGQGSRKVCPQSTDRYTLEVNLKDGTRNMREVKIRVRQ